MKHLERRIIHIDMDAFFAAVEQRDYPQYRGKPVIIGGSPQSRGVVSTCSYEARKFGIHSAMPSYLAHKLCPQGIFLSGRYNVYMEISKQLMDILLEITPQVERLSLDEAFLDVTEITNGLNDTVKIAQNIRSRIKNELHLTASAGVSYNKFLAKLASDMEKPDGLTIITKRQAPKLLEELEIRKFYGIGNVTEQKMFKLGINNGKDLKGRSLSELTKHFGQAGKFFHDIIRGIDNRPVNTSYQRKSLGKERTLANDTFDIWEMNKVLEGLAIEIAAELKRNNLQGKTITLKIKYSDFMLNTRSLSVNNYINEEEQIIIAAKKLLETNYKRDKGVRLLGIFISHLNNEKNLSPQQFLDFYLQHEGK